MANKRDPLTAIDPLTTLHHDTAAPEMAILGLPAVRMANDDAVAAKEIVFSALEFGTRHPVRHAVAEGRHHARRSSKDRHAGPHGGHVADRDIGSLVAVVAMIRAAEIAHSLLRVVID